MSVEHSHSLSTSAASCIPSTISVDDIQILFTSPALSASTLSHTNGSSSSSSSDTNNSSPSSSNSLSYSSE